MAQIGLKYLVCAKIKETDNDVSYDNGMVMSSAIKADISIEINEAQLFADDRAVEVIKEFKSGKLTINGDHITNEVKAMLLGHKIETLSEGGEKLIAKGSDDGNFVGVGFFATSIKNGIRKFRAIWLHKIKFGVPNESLETKGESINFQTPTLEGTVMTDVLNIWKEECTFDTEKEAIKWLNEITGIEGAEEETP